MPQPHALPDTQNSPAFLQGGGEMGALMRAYNWQDHPMGNPENWDDSLKTMIRMMLNSAFPMFVWWSDELYMFHNDAYLPALGNKHPKALGACARDMWAEIWHQLGGVVEDILRSGTQFYAEDLPIYLNRKSFLEETYWTFSYSPAFNETGNVCGIFCACKEVTTTVIGQRRLKALKNLTEALLLVQTLEEAGEKACQIMQENEADIPFSLIYLLEPNSNELYLVGHAGDADTQSLQHVVDLDKHQAPWALSDVHKSHHETVIELEEPIRTATAGEVKQVAVIPVTLPAQSNTIGYLVAGISSRLSYDSDYRDFHALLVGQIATSFTSINARKEIERRQVYLQEIFQQAPVGITILHGPNYLIDLANPGICEIWGRRQEELLGRPVLEALPEVVDQGIKELLDGVYHTGVPFVANELPVMLQREGTMEKVYLNFVYHPMHDDLGNITGVIAVAIDINEQVEARHKIEGMNRELLSINADLDNFVYSASHDLKAPISNIEGLMGAFVDFLPSELLATREVQHVLRLIQSSIDRFKRAISDLTEVAKIQREGNEDVAKVNLAAVIEDVVLDFEPLIKEKGAAIDLQLAPGSVVEFSAKNIRSVVYNLLSNALKYSAPLRAPHIRISTELSPGFISLTVADNGLGFNPADEHKIFTMFKRLHDHVEGTGVGLYIVKRIVENAGGRIELESEPGVGSTFKVYFRLS